MIQWAFIFLVATLIATPFAFGGVRPGAEDVAQGLFALFFALFLGAAFLYLRRRRRSRKG
jgi:LPXTG-motif cell wall-anchored protein